MKFQNTSTQFKEEQLIEITGEVDLSTTEGLPNLFSKLTNLKEEPEAAIALQEISRIPLPSMVADQIKLILQRHDIQFIHA
ncbi:MAG: hypothetical protein WCV50_04950 [Patescibacteria group bacterium]